MNSKNFSIDSQLIKAKFFNKQGEFDKAQNIYQTILKSYPKNMRALKALKALSPENKYNRDKLSSQTLNKLVNMYNNKEFNNLINEAESLLKKYPESHFIWNIKGATQKILGRVNDALISFTQVVRLNPYFPEGFNNLGTILMDQGKFEEAIKNFDQALLLNPDYTICHYNKGIIFKNIGRFDEAIEVYYKAISLKPDYAEAYNNIGVILKEQDKLEEAVEVYNKALSINPNFFEALFNLSIVLRHQNKFDEAIQSYIKVLSIKPNNVDAYNDLGIIRASLGEFNQALELFKKALVLKPDFADVYNNIGNINVEQGMFTEALEMFRKSLTINPRQYDALNNISNIYQVQGHLKDAIDASNKALTIKPDYEFVRAKKLYQQAQLCDWEGISNDINFIPLLGINKQSVSPFDLLSLEDAPERHKKRSEVFFKDKFFQTPLDPDLKPKKNSKIIRIGYFSADFKEHVVSRLIANVIETHNKNNFIVYGYSLKKTTEDVLQKRLISSLDIFRDVSQATDKEVALLAREDGIDIAIDLNGYTQNSRTRIFAYRTAPIQISYLGYPGTMGSDFIDYIIADTNLIPESSQCFYSEKPIYLPDTYMPGDNNSKISIKYLSRNELGLPDDAFVFCAINNSYKISLSIFEIWMRLLRKVNNSVLWLLSPNDDVKSHIIKVARDNSINPNRLVFAEPKPYEQYIGQFSKADLFLDTFTYNAGATANNVLWAGLPIVTKSGKSYTSRMATSMLKAIGLDELVTKTEKEYEDLIFDLATNPQKLEKIRVKLSKNRFSKPLFNIKLFTKNLEEGYRRAYENYALGNKPKTIKL